MTKTENYIFLSYAREDYARVKAVFNRLKHAQLSPWMDIENLSTGQEWEIETEEKLRKASLVIIFLSNLSIRKRGYFQREINMALDVKNEIPEGQDYIFPVRLEECNVPSKLSTYHFCDLFKDGGFESLLNSIYRQLGVKPFIPPDPVEILTPTNKLRKVALKKLSETEVNEMLKANDFFDAQIHPDGNGISHDYQLKSINTNKVVIDRTTGLIWQQSGSTDSKTFNQANIYIMELNRANAFDDNNKWRLPTLEEAMSLMEAKPNNSALFINEVFNEAQKIIWTCDHYNDRGIWKVDYGGGSCFGYHVGNNIPRCKIRAVRTIDENKST